MAMIFDRILHRLLPTDEHFYDLFEEQSKLLIAASELVQKLARAKTPAERDKFRTQISVVEHQADDVAHQVFSELNSTFVTPFDREDIHQLASALDDIIDHIDGSAGRISLYKLKKVPESMVRLIDILHLSIAELDKGIRLLRDLKEVEGLQRVFKTVNEYENEADAVFEKAVAELFDKVKDPIQIIKLKEIYVGFETATDMCEDAANVLEGIFIKHA
jgi:predicted phosphate transport protein (TIGR00153 family)